MCCSQSSSARHVLPFTSNNLQFYHDHADKADVVLQLKKEYESALDEGNCLLKGAHAIVNVVLGFVQNCQDKNSGVTVNSFLEQNFLLMPAQINEKYESAENVITLYRKMKEYKLQSLLLLEMESATSGEASAATCTEKLTLLLRMFSIIAGPHELNSFIHETLVERYGSHLPKILEDIGEELNIPLLCKDHSSPLSLNNHTLHSRVGKQSGLIRHPGSVVPGITRDRNLRSSKMRFPMLGDLRTKRQIMVPKLLPSEHKRGKLKSVDYSHQTERIELTKMATLITSESSSKVARLQAPKKGLPNIKKIRRTLFGNDNETSGTGTSSEVSSRIPYTLVGNKACFSQGPCILKESSVLETPLHKQGSSVSRQKAHLKRKWDPNATVDVVEESPIKVTSRMESLAYTIRPFRSIKRPTSRVDDERAKSRNLQKARAKLVADRIRGDALSPRSILFAELLNSPSAARSNDLAAHSSCSVERLTSDSSRPNSPSTAWQKIYRSPNASVSSAPLAGPASNVTPKSHARKAKKMALDFDCCDRTSSPPVGSLSERSYETVDAVSTGRTHFPEEGWGTLAKDKISKREAKPGVGAMASFVRMAKCPASNSLCVQSEETSPVARGESPTGNSARSSPFISEVGCRSETVAEARVDASVHEEYVCRFTRSKSKATGLSPSTYVFLSQSSPRKLTTRSCTKQCA